MSNQFILKVRRERTDQTPTDLEFGEVKFTDLNDRLHIGKHDGTVVSFGNVTQFSWNDLTEKPTTFSGLNLPLQLSDIPAGIDYATLQNRPDISALDDVLDYPTVANFPLTGQTGVLYIALDTGLFYRWAASQYVQLTGKAATWGDIVGSLADQADLKALTDSLQNRLDALENDAGKVLQTEQDSDSTTQTLNTTWADCGLSVTMTPRDANSRFLVLVNVPYRLTANAGLGLVLYRNGTEVHNPNPRNTTGPYLAFSDSGPQYGVASFDLLDSPASASQITYTVRARSYDTNEAIVKDDSGVATLTVQEIAG